jgi:hypothetical protein
MQDGAMVGPQPRRNCKEVVMTKLFKLFSLRLLTLGSAKASTLGVEGQLEEDEISRFTL